MVFDALHKLIARCNEFFFFFSGGQRASWLAMAAAYVNIHCPKSPFKRRRGDKNKLHTTFFLLDGSKESKRVQ